MSPDPYDLLFREKFKKGPNPHYSHFHIFFTNINSCQLSIHSNATRSPISTNIMETHRRHKANSTGDIFTFPAMSPDIKFESELADQLFFNGKFLLHDFPVKPTNFNMPRSMILSRTSSISSKSSLMSSRSNSTNSRTSSNSNSTSNSSCTSARTSTSEASYQKKLTTINQGKSLATKTTKTNNRFPNKESQRQNYCNNKYGHSQRWQFIAPTPVVLSPRNSLKKRKVGKKGKRDCVVRKGICRRFLGWLVSTCQECHAIEPSKRMKVRMWLQYFLSFFSIFHGVWLCNCCVFFSSFILLLVRFEYVNCLFIEMELFDVH